MAIGIADFQVEPWQHETASLEDCCRWPAHGLSKIRGGPDTVIPLISGRRLDTPGACYGIGGPKTSDQVIAAGCDEYIDAASDAYQSGPRPIAIRFANRWAIEKDGVCQAEIIHAANEELPFAPKHLFGDICSFLTPIWVLRCGLDPTVKGWSHERLARELPYAKLSLSAHCLICQKQCKLTTTHLHRAGSPCVHHSNMGDRRREGGGKTTFFVLCLHMGRPHEDGKASCHPPRERGKLRHQ